LAFVSISLPGTERFTGSCSCQDQKFERPCCRSLLLAQTQQEGWQVAIWHGSVVNDLLGLAGFRQEVIEVSAPARRVLAVAVASRVPVSILSTHNARELQVKTRLWMLHFAEESRSICLAMTRLIYVHTHVVRGHTSGHLIGQASRPQMANWPDGIEAFWISEETKRPETAD
jgi:hypothetical protein